MTEKTFKKYKLVIDEYFVNGFNGTKAYQKFYPNSSYESADASFRHIFGIPRIEEYVKSKQKDSQKALRTSHEALLEELENWAYSDITETISLTTDQIKDLPKEIRRLITKYKHTTRTVGDSDIVESVIELSFVSKEKAMEMIHKHTGFYAEHNYQKNNDLSKEERAKRIAELKEKLNK